MESRQLGRSGISVTALSLGSWLTFEYIDERDALAVMRRAIDAGIDFLDDARYDDRTGTAPLATGYSEVVFGRLLRKGGWKRSDLVIANKLWFEFYPRENVAQELDGSLDRLQTDYLDLEYCAEPPDGLPMIELLQQLDRVIAAGKLRAWGVLNWPAAKIADACRLANAEGLRPPCAAQLPYSVVQRSPVEDAEMERVCDANGVSVVASYSLHGGLLSGKYTRADTGADRRLDAAQLEALRANGALQRADDVAAVARELGCTPAQLAFAYCLKNPRVASVLFGAKSVEQVAENLGALDVLPSVDAGVLGRLRRIAP
jgi:aryl-alcohol dehydrogenase-like predicted oxidoreductase